MSNLAVFTYGDFSTARYRIPDEELDSDFIRGVYEVFALFNFSLEYIVGSKKSVIYMTISWEIVELQ
jgi:hypothetical protein